MIQMGKSMPCLYEQMAAVPAMASAQQSGNSNNSSNNSSNNNSNNNVSQSYEEMLGGSSGAGGMSLVPQSGASGQFQPTPDEIEESRTVDKMAYNSWKGMLARNIGRAGESWRTLTLWELREAEVDMFCTVIVGNVSTKEIAGRLITPRGYKNV